jgi:hypothetical protein
MIRQPITFIQVTGCASIPICFDRRGDRKTVIITSVEKIREVFRALT